MAPLIYNTLSIFESWAAQPIGAAPAWGLIPIWAWGLYGLGLLLALLQSSLIRDFLNYTYWRMFGLAIKTFIRLQQWRVRTMLWGSSALLSVSIWLFRRGRDKGEDIRSYFPPEYISSLIEKTIGARLSLWVWSIGRWNPRLGENFIKGLLASLPQSYLNYAELIGFTFNSPYSDLSGKRRIMWLMEWFKALVEVAGDDRGALEHEIREYFRPRKHHEF